MSIESKIPKHIIQYWNTDEVPEEIKRLMSSWKEKNPEYQYTLYNRKKAIDFIYDIYGKEIASLFESARLPAMQSDIFRVAYILKNGGIYVDAATICLKDINTLIDNSSDLLLMKKWNNNIWNGFIVASPDNIILKKIFNQIILNVKNKEIKNIWLATGPGLFNNVVENLESAEKTNFKILEQVKECKIFFDLVNDLEHKNKSHWSKKQKEIDIYNDNSNSSIFSNGVVG